MPLSFSSFLANFLPFQLRHELRPSSFRTLLSVRVRRWLLTCSIVVTDAFPFFCSWKICSLRNWVLGKRAILWLSFLAQKPIFHNGLTRQFRAHIYIVSGKLYDAEIWHFNLLFILTSIKCNYKFFELFYFYEKINYQKCKLFCSRFVLGCFKSCQ